MDEVWKPVPYAPFDKAYSVSNFGRVKPNTPSRYSKNKAEVLKPSPGTRGYLHISLYAEGKGRSCFIHRMVALAFLGEPPTTEHIVCHKDECKTNNHVDNLEWGTPKQNCASRDTIGKHNRGSANGHARLTEDKVRAIRAAHATGQHTQAELADMFDISAPSIHNVVSNKSWRHVT